MLWEFLNGKISDRYIALQFLFFLLLELVLIRFQFFSEQYFTKNVICYCSNCCDARGEHRVTVCGDPPQEYARPIGWCKFELRSDQKFQLQFVSRIAV
jgi:hypothetical protein